MERGTIKKIVEKTIHALILTLVVSLPLIYAPWTYRVFSVPKSAVLLLLAVCLALLSFILLASRRPTAMWWIVATFAGIVVISAIFSIAPWMSVGGSYRQQAGVLYWVSLSAIALAASSIQWNLSRLFNLLSLLVVTGAIAAVLALAQHSFPPLTEAIGLGSPTRPSGPLGNANYLGSFLAFTLPVAVGLAYLARTSTVRIFMWTMTAITLVGLIATTTRGAWIGAGFGLIAFFLVAKRSALKPRSDSTTSFTTRTKLAIAGASIIAVLAVISWVPLERVSSELSTLSARLSYWDAAASQIKETPLFGSGPDTYGYVFPLHARSSSLWQDPDKLLADDAHNIFIQITTTIGLLGVTIFLALLFMATMHARHWFERLSAEPSVTDVSRSRGLYVIALAGGTVGYLVSVSTTIGSLGTAFIPWIFIGVALSSSIRSPIQKTDTLDHANRLKKAPLVLIGIPVIIFSILAVSFSVRSVLADSRFLAALRAPSVSMADDHMQTAISLWPNNRFYWQTRAQMQADTDPEQAESFAYEAVRTDPKSHTAWLLLAHFYQGSGATLPNSRALGRDAAREGLKLYPRSAVLHRLLDQYSQEF